MSKPIIGIAANQLPAGSADFLGNPITYTPQGFVAATQQVGGLPLLLPISKPETAADYISKIDKLLLAGGQDIEPLFYGEDPHPKLEATNIERDLFENALIEEALKQQKPIFAVCRGMQLLNVTLGGNLYQDLSLHPEWNVRHNQYPTPPHFATHEIEVERDSLLSQLVGENYRVNSYHHQAIKRLGKNLKTVAHSNDQIIEAVEWHDKSQRVLGIQWHPELTYQTEPKELKLFDYFVNEL